LSTLDLIAAINAADVADMPALLAAIAGRLAEPRAANVPGEGTELVDIDEAERLTGMSKSFLYHQRLPFAVKVGRRRMFSRTGIKKFIEKNSVRD
jgi:hypothetical protein